MTTTTTTLDRIGLPLKGKIYLQDLESSLIRFLHEENIGSDDMKRILSTLKKIGNPYFDSHRIHYYTPRYGSKGDHKDGWISSSLLSRIRIGLITLEEEDLQTDSQGDRNTPQTDSQNI